MRITAERKAQRPADDARSKAFIRNVSRRGANNTITFSNVEDMPSFLRYGAAEDENRNSNEPNKQVRNYFINKLIRIVFFSS